MAGPVEVDAGVAADFSAAGSTSPVDAIVSIEWDFSFDGTFVPSGQLGVVQGFTFSAAGPTTVAVRVTDIDGDTDTATLDLNVIESGPEAIVDGPSEVTEGNPVQFDGTLSRAGANAVSSYEWDFDYDGVFSPSAVAAQPVHSFDDDGDYVVALRVRDAQGREDLATLAIEIKDASPTAELTGPIEWVEGAEAEFDARDSTSPVDAITTYEWDFDYDGSFESRARGRWR